MNTETISKQMEDLHEDNVVELSPIIKAKLAGKGPESFNWLKGLEEGTIFLCRPSRAYSAGPEVVLKEYLVYNNKPEKATWLIEQTPMGALPQWVHSETFSLKNEKIEVLKTIKIEEIDNGNNNRGSGDESRGTSGDMAGTDPDQTLDPEPKGA